MIGRTEVRRCVSGWQWCDNRIVYRSENEIAIVQKCETESPLVNSLADGPQTMT
jgi:hypothetical protein